MSARQTHFLVQFCRAFSLYELFGTYIVKPVKHSPSALDRSPAYPSTYVEKAHLAALSNTHSLANRCRGLTPDEWNDTVQELIVHALAGARQFDPSRASEATYVNLRCKSRAAECLKETIKIRMSEQSLDVIAEGEGGDDAGEEGGYVAHVVRAALASAQDLSADIRSDLQTAVRHMSVDQTEVFTLMAEGRSVSEICSRLDISPATYHRQAHDIRMHLRMFGFKEAA